jgi:hypothetical protein
MIQIYAKDVLRAIGDLERIIKSVHGIKERNPAEIISKSRNKVVLRQLAFVRKVCDELNLADANNRLNELILDLESTNRNASEVHADLRGLLIAFVKELRRVVYVLIPNEKLKYLEQEHLFGDEVYEKIKSARADIKNAGNCLAADLPDAAVFHLCRVTELGLRALAKKLKIKLTHPLEYADWGNVIDEVETKLRDLKPVTRGKKKSQKLEFYSNMVSDCRAIKETWRDCVMHTRKFFNDHEALRAYDRVRDFMQRLALRVSE